MKIQFRKSKLYLDRVRDVFLFQYFTGLRYSDVCNLRCSDVKENHIEVTTVNTTDSLTIELNNHSKAILDKLTENDEPARETFNKVNERIDIVTSKCELLGTHAGRRTFTCNALSLGIPAQVVMKWTGHSEYNAMKPDLADNGRGISLSSAKRRATGTATICHC